MASQYACLLLLTLSALLTDVKAACSCTYAPGCTQDTSTGRCQRREDYSYYVRQAQHYSYGCGTFRWRRCRGTRYQPAIAYSYRCNLYCCADYYQGGSSCYPRCSPNCINGGTCTSPWTCTCPPGWTGGYCQTPICSPGCQNGGTCSSPGVCSCTSDWTGSRCETPVCTPGCQNGGICTSPGECTCELTRWKGSRCEIPFCTPGCANSGTCSSPGVCTCTPGWEGSRCTADIDECARGTHHCDQDCANTIGSYTCSCRSGFRLQPDGKGCVDINECLENNPCDQTCTNTIGSFVCGCNIGYRQIGQTACVDINECVENNPCNHMELCTNIVGSFVCGCRTGFELSGSTSCIDINECDRFCNKASAWCQYPCDQFCQNNIGSFTCTCDIGYELYQPTKCRDIDECVVGTYQCENVCANNIGSYECACQPGNVLQADGLNCEKFNPLNPAPITADDASFVSTLRGLLQCATSVCACVQSTFTSLATDGYGSVLGMYDLVIPKAKSVEAGDVVLALFDSKSRFALPILSTIESMKFSCSESVLSAHTFTTTAYHSLFRDLLNLTDISMTIGVHVSTQGSLNYLRLSGKQTWGGLDFAMTVDLTNGNLWSFEATGGRDTDFVSFINDAFNAGFPSDTISTTVTLTNSHKIEGVIDVNAGYEFYLVIRGTLLIGTWFQHDVCIIVNHIISAGGTPEVFFMTGCDSATPYFVSLSSFLNSLANVDISSMAFFNTLNLDDFHITFATPGFAISAARLSQLGLSDIPLTIPNQLSDLQFVFNLQVPSLSQPKRWAFSYSTITNAAKLQPVLPSNDDISLTDMFSTISTSLTVPPVPLVQTDVRPFSVEKILLSFDQLQSRLVISNTHSIEIVANLIYFTSHLITFPISLNGGVQLLAYNISGEFLLDGVLFKASIEYDGSAYQCKGSAEGVPNGVSGLLNNIIPSASIYDISDFFSASSGSIGKRTALNCFGSSGMGLTDILIKFIPMQYAQKICFEGKIYSGQYATVRGALCIFNLQDYTLGFDISDFIVAPFIHGVFGNPVYHVPFFSQQYDTILVYSSFNGGSLPWVSQTYRYLEQESILQGVSFYSVSSWPDPCSTEFCIVARDLLGAGASFHVYTYFRNRDHLLLKAGLKNFNLGLLRVRKASLIVEFNRPDVYIGLNGTIDIPRFSVSLEGAIQLRYPGLQIVADFYLGSTHPDCSDVTSELLGQPKGFFKRFKIDFCHAYLYARLGQGIARPSANIGLVAGIGDKDCYRIETSAFAGLLSPRPTTSIDPSDFDDKYVYLDANGKITLLSIIDMLFCTKLSGSIASFFFDIGFSSGFTISVSTLEYTVPQTGLYIRKGFYLRGSLQILQLFHRYAEIHFDPPDVIDIKVGLPPVIIAGGLIKIVESRSNHRIGPSVRFVLRNIPSFNFLFELSGYVHILGISVEGKMSISHERYEVFVAGKIFDFLGVELTAYINYGSALSAGWGVRGVLQSNILQAIEDAVVATIGAAGDLAQKALDVPQKAVEGAQRLFHQASGVLRSAQDKASSARNRVATERSKVAGWRRHLDSLCSYRRCRKVCIPLLLCPAGCKRVWGKCVLPWFKWSSCCFQIPNPLCVAYNIVCFILRSPFELLIFAAQALLLILEVALAIAEIALVSAQILVEGSKLVLEAAKIALDVVRRVLKFAIQALEAISRFLLTGIINITEIGFNVRLQAFYHGKIAVHVDVSFFRSSSQRLQLTLPIFNPLAIVKDLVSRALPGLGRKRRSTARSIQKVYWLANHFKQKGTIYPM